MQMTCAEAVTVLQGRDFARSKRDKTLAALSLVKIVKAGGIQQVLPMPTCIRALALAVLKQYLSRPRDTAW